MELIVSLLLITLLVCAVGVSFTRNLLNAVIIFSAYSFVMAIIWFLLESPDLAITEAAVGAGVTSILFFVTLKKMNQIRVQKRRAVAAEGIGPVRDAVAAEGIGPVRDAVAAEGIEPVRGAVAAEGIEPVRGAVAAEGIGPVRGTVAAEGIEPVRGTVAAEGIKPARGAKQAETAVSKRAAGREVHHEA